MSEIKTPEIEATTTVDEVTIDTKTSERDSAAPAEVKEKASTSAQTTSDDDQQQKKKRIRAPRKRRASKQSKAADAPAKQASSKDEKKAKAARNSPRAAGSKSRDRTNDGEPNKTNILTIGRKPDGSYVRLVKGLFNNDLHEVLELHGYGATGTLKLTNVMRTLVNNKYCQVVRIKTGTKPAPVLKVSFKKTAEFKSVFDSWEQVQLEKREERDRVKAAEKAEREAASKEKTTKEESSKEEPSKEESSKEEPTKEETSKEAKSEKEASTEKEAADTAEKSSDAKDESSAAEAPTQ